MATITYKTYQTITGPRQVQTQNPSAANYVSPASVAAWSPPDSAAPYWRISTFPDISTDSKTSEIESPSGIKWSPGIVNNGQTSWLQSQDSNRAGYVPPRQIQTAIGEYNRTVARAESAKIDPGAYFKSPDTSIGGMQGVTVNGQSGMVQTTNPNAPGYVFSGALSTARAVQQQKIDADARQAARDHNPSFGEALAEFDDGVREIVPGGWATLASIAGGAAFGPWGSTLANATANAIKGESPADILKHAAMTFAATYGMQALKDAMTPAIDQTVSAIDSGTITPADTSVDPDSLFDTSIDGTSVDPDSLINTSVDVAPVNPNVIPSGPATPTDLNIGDTTDIYPSGTKVILADGTSGVVGDSGTVLLDLNPDIVPTVAPATPTLTVQDLPPVGTPLPPGTSVGVMGPQIGDEIIIGAPTAPLDVNTVDFSTYTPEELQDILTPQEISQLTPASIAKLTSEQLTALNIPAPVIDPATVLTQAQIAVLGGTAAAAAVIASSGGAAAATAANQAIASSGGTGATSTFSGTSTAPGPSTTIPGTTTPGTTTPGPTTPGPTTPGTAPVVPVTTTPAPVTTTPAPTTPSDLDPDLGMPGEPTGPPVMVPPSPIIDPTGLNPWDIAKLLALGYLLTSKGLVPPNPTPREPMPIPTYDTSGLVRPGVNPGFIHPAPAYGNQQPGVDQYYWGQHRYAQNMSDLAKLNQPAPAQPYGNPNAVNLGRLITPEQLGYPNPQQMAASQGAANPIPGKMGGLANMDYNLYRNPVVMNTAPPPIPGQPWTMADTTQGQMARGQSMAQQVGQGLNYLYPVNPLTLVSPADAVGPTSIKI